MESPICKGELVQLVSDKYDKLNSLWSQYGFLPSTIERRNKIVLKHTTDLFEEMITEEERRVQEKRDELAGHQRNVAKLCKDLEEQVPSMSATTLIQQCEELLAMESQFKEKKAEKMKEWIELKEKEKSLKEDLGEIVSGDATDFDGIPGKTDIEHLKGVLKELAREKARRIKEYAKLKPRVKELLALLERTASTRFEKSIIDNEDATLSLEYLTHCKEAEAALEVEAEFNRTETIQLREEIEELRVRLKDEPEAAGAPLPEGYKPSVLAKVRAEHARLTKLKMSNLSKFIERLRVEIEQLSETVYKEADLPEVVEATEVSLDMHERVLESLKTYQIEHKKLLELWRKRESVWTQWLEYEAKADDPNRLNNRGGTLLKEEKIRKGLEKSLPKLEKEIMSLAESCPEFKVLGKDVKDIIEEQRESFNRDKEEKKMLKKQHAGTNNTMNVTRKRPMTPGTGTSNTPAGKRGKLMPVTPVKNPATTTPKRALRSSTSKDNLPPSPTYSEFTSYKQIFQSTMNEPKGSVPKSPARGRVIATPKMTPREISDKF